MSEWQPIATAPAESYLLLWGPKYTRPISEYWLGDRVCGWATPPTHWMPLPPPPTEERLRIWKKHLARLNLNPRQIAERLEVTAQVAYGWNCGQIKIPEARLRQIEEMK